MPAPRSRPRTVSDPRPGPRPGRVLVAAIAVVLAGCAAAPAPSVSPDAPPASAGAPAAAAPVLPAPSASPAGVACGGPHGEGARRVRLGVDVPLSATLGAPAALGLELLGRGAGCGDRVVLAPADDPVARTLAATTAVLRGAPLLLVPGERLDLLPSATGRVVARRLDAVGAVDREAVVAATPDEQVAALRALVDARVDVVTTVVLVAASDVVAQAEVVARVPSGLLPLVVDATRDGLELAALVAPFRALDGPPTLRWAASSTAASEALVALGVDALDIERAAIGDDAPPTPVMPAELWLGDARDPSVALVAAVGAAVRDGAFVAVDGADLRAGAGRTARIRALAAALPPDGPVVLVGGGADADWQLDTVLDGTPLPGGGFLPLEDRRIVALYGSPGAPSLGLLGEQDLEATLERARAFAAGYEDAVDGRTVVPGLDVITTVASAFAEPTGDYSRRVPIDRLRPLVDRAGEEGMAVLLDLQPGRTDFLTQAQEYVELLREPHVHLALDPEWRIGPDERHLQRIGSVEAAEVQAVADWLAALVRRERLPQKVLMLHQFTLDMLRDRDTVAIPPELVGVVHVDGQGPLPTKDRTYAAMTDGAEERWAWGWKNFTRIDVPMATPERTLDRTPVPLIVTYQ